MDPSSCVVLVPAGGHIEPACEKGLKELERRGYPVERVAGFAAIDFGRCLMAGEALRAGFEELMWIDADTLFNPDDVDKLRAHRLPIVSGICAKKGRREFACHFLPGTEKVVFGQSGGLIELHYAGFGFVLTHRSVFDRMREHLRLPACNQRFGPAVFPWFLPMVVEDAGGPWYLGEDYAFCERARQCGYTIWADTSVRLYHIGSYGYSWEDAGGDQQRFADYTFYLKPPSNTPVQ